MFKIPKLVLENGLEITGENTISEYIGETHDKSINWTPGLRAETHEWLSRSSKFTTNPEEVYVASQFSSTLLIIQAFDSWMAPKCFALRTGQPTWVDYFLYARIHPVVVRNLSI